MTTHAFTPPLDVAEVLARHGWPTEPTFDDVELAGQVLGGLVASWADRIVSTLNRTLPATTGTAFLDDEFHIVGVGLTAGGTAGVQTDYAITDLARSDACFTLRALDQGFKRVRPMPQAPVAMIDVITGKSLDGSLLAAGENEPAPEIPDGARVFVEVDPAQREVVYDVWAVAPSTSPGGLGVWRRHDGQWMDDPGFLATLRGESPPTLIYLPDDSPMLADVLSQVDASTADQAFEPLTASITLSPEIFTDLLPLIARGTRGGLAKASGVGKGGNAEVLREFWQHGKGATKIRWGIGGDWYRCVRYLRKYLGIRAKAYCAKMHIDVLGYNTTTHKRMLKGGKG